MEEIISSFFNIDNIVKTMHVILQTCKVDQVDPIVDTILQLVRLPIGLALTDVGYAPFKNDNTIIIPYESMTCKQLEILMTCARNMKVDEMYIACVQMGGGLYMRSINQSKIYFIDPALVLFASNVLIRNSVSSEINKKNISNVVIQRVMGAVCIPHEKILEAETLSRNHFNIC